MIYRKFQDMELSALGFGAMRLPVLDGDDGKVDVPAAREMVDYAIAHGVNYFDTGWDYHLGKSEVVLGQALARHPRDSWYLADKCPGYDLNNMDRAEEIFEQQLERCGVDYFDFYLFHNVCELNIDGYLDPKYGILPYLLRQKENGRIRHLGFSTHGNMPVLKRFLEACGEQMEFCQIQANYIDWEFQSAREKAELLGEYHIPIWLMEPLRGGRLASLTEEQTAVLRGMRPEESVPAWAFRFTQTLPNVVVTLSGMSSLDQVKDNVAIFQTEAPLSEGEMTALLDMARGMVDARVLPCTGCRYCVSYCPQNLDIPSLLSLYNEHAFTGGGFIAPMALGAVPRDRQPSCCVGCRSCEAVCPQQLKISEAMADFSKMLSEVQF